MYLLFFANAPLLIRNFGKLDNVYFGKKPSLRNKPLIRLGKLKQRQMSSSEESDPDESQGDYGSFIGKSKMRRAFMKEQNQKDMKEK
jgi:hypothetical protein